jgi:hypothetical protein
LNTQPAVTIVVQGEAGVEGDTVSELNIQTSVSERFTLAYEAGDASSLAKCPYMPAVGRYIVDFAEQREGNEDLVVQSRQYSSSDTRRPSEGEPPHPIGTVPLPPGNYEVSIATFDSHNDDYDQNAETVYLGLLNGGEVDAPPFAYTGVSPELAHVPENDYNSYLRLDYALEESDAVLAGDGVRATMVNPHYMNMNYATSFLNMDANNTLAYPVIHLTLNEEVTHFYIYHAHPQATKKIATLEPRTYEPISYPRSPGQNLPAYTCPGVDDFEDFCESEEYYYRDDGSAGRFSKDDCKDALNEGFCPKGYGGGSHAHSLVFLCAAFDSLDGADSFIIEDF